ncbi:MAG: 3-(methylthio)propionyl-CoA ligase [Reyranellaceae bacterium]
MLGLMQNRPLLISSLLEHAAAFHGDTEIVTRTVEGPIHRYTYAALARRSKRLANALARLGVTSGTRIGTLAWNTHRHLELYFGVSGMGAVLHTVNPRLFAEQIEYIVDHAEDQYLFFDSSFLDLVERLAPSLPKVKGFILLADRARMPASGIPNLLCYEDLLAGESEAFDWPSFDENTASSLCYTSGTTGNPKGVLYSHRSTVLHSFAICQRDGFNLGAEDSVLVVVPLFHANGWGMPYGAAMCGAKLVFPGPAMDGKSIYDLLRDEQCSFSLAVPTVWLGFFQYIDSTNGLQPATEIKLERLVIGGSAAPPAMIRRFAEQFGAYVLHAWGMTEMSPLGTSGRPLRKHAGLSLDQRIALQSKQGRVIYGVELKITDDSNAELPHDGIAFGDIKVRGPWIAAGYFRNEGGAVMDGDGWFATGDVGTLDGDGYLQITDRSKDVIKSGGEWISSIDLENAAIGHPAVQEAAVIGVYHDKWQERPLLIVVRKPGASVDRDALLEYLRPRVAKWWLPDDVVFVADLPHTATGKLQKSKLRERFKEYRLPIN